MYGRENSSSSRAVLQSIGNPPWQGGDFEYVSDKPIVRHFMIVAETGFAKDYTSVGDTNVPVNVQYELDLDD